MEKKDYTLPISIVISAIIISVAWVYTTGLSAGDYQKEENSKTKTVLKNTPSQSGVILPIIWGDLGSRLVSEGVIAPDKLKAIYDERGVFTDEYNNLLFEKNNERLKITKDNAGYLLNLFWALGLGNKNKILESGEMSDPRYGGPQNFASTGGWTIAKGDSMDHYSKHSFLGLTSEQQDLVDRVSKNVYRPCCNNSTHFPDCNHGMAMLGLLELMAYQGVSESDMYDIALLVNELWFSEAYSAIDEFIGERFSLSSKDILGPSYSSARGYGDILNKITPQKRDNGSCRV